MSFHSAPEVPFVDVAADLAAFGDELAAAVQRVLGSGRLVLGPEVRAFEEEWAAYCGVRHCVTVNSGTDALRLALRAYGVGPGDEVVTVSHSFVATSFAVELTGARPVWADVDPVTGTMDPESAAAAITPDTRALLPVHLYGRCADMGRLRELADRHGLRLLEDAAQAHGATYDGRRAGGLGDAACFSFYPTKNLGAAGDAGAVVTDDGSLASRIRSLRNYGESRKHRHDEVAGNSRLDELQAAILRTRLCRLDDLNAARRIHAARYHAGLAGSSVRTPDLGVGMEHVFHLYVVRAAERDALARHLKAQGVGYGLHYPVPAHLQPAFVRPREGAISLPATETWAREVISLPLYARIPDAHVDRAIEAVRGFAGDHQPLPTARRKAS
jgi:dTDP-4-amino-4,6-dideoxygalactose transaminase